MPERPIRSVQCPYCKQKFGIQQDQAVEFCFFCGGRLNVQPKIEKPNLLLVWSGAVLKRVKENLEERQREVELARPTVPVPQEPVSPFMEESSIPEVDDYHFDPVAQIWVAPNEPEELIFLDDEIEFFDPVASLRGEMPSIEEPPAEVKKEPLDLIEQLRYAASSGPTFLETEQPAEPALTGRTRIIVLGGIAVVVVVILFILMAKMMG
jgi:hypothetical protein